MSFFDKVFKTMCDQFNNTMQFFDLSQHEIGFLQQYSDNFAFPTLSSKF